MKLRNDILWSVGAAATPLVVALLMFPRLRLWLDPTSLGIVTVILVIVSFSTVMDLGVSKAATYFISTASPERREALFIHFLKLGIASSVMLSLIYFFLFFLFRQAGLSQIAQLTPTAAAAIYTSLLLNPIICLTNISIASFDALRDFRSSAWLRTMAASSHFIAIFAAAAVTTDLRTIALSVFGLKAAVAAHCLQRSWCNLRLVRGKGEPVGSEMRAGINSYLFHIWGSNLIGSSLTYLDRLTVSFYVAVAQLPYYNIPADLLTKSHVANGALAQVALPRLASSSQDEFVGRLSLFFRLGIYAYLWIAVIVISFAHELLSLWMGRQFADRSGPIAAVIAAGVCFTAISQVLYVAVLAKRRPFFATINHSIQLVVMAPLMMIGASHFGPLGAAVAWACRCLLDCAMLLFFFGTAMFRDWRTPALLVASAAALAASFSLMSVAAVTSKLAWVALILAALLATGLLDLRTSMGKFNDY